MNLSVGQSAMLACLLEVTAPKPGNVHRGADFENLTYFDFVASAVAIGPAMEAARENGLGQTVLAAIEATQQAVGTNTNLGTVLLIAPLAMADGMRSAECGVRSVRSAFGGESVIRNSQSVIASWRAAIKTVLSSLTPRDSQLVYQAIRLANPGGLGRVKEADIASEPPPDLLAAMRLAADRDLVARQYAENFDQVLGFVVPSLAELLDAGISLSDAIVQTHLRLMSQFPDSLIARKCGMEVAQEAADRAAETLAAGRSGSEEYRQSLSHLDFWLRSDHHRRNPGTSADLMAAGLFVAVRSGIISAPYRL